MPTLHGRFGLILKLTLDCFDTDGFFFSYFFLYISLLVISTITAGMFLSPVINTHSNAFYTPSCSSTIANRSQHHKVITPHFGHPSSYIPNFIYALFHRKYILRANDQDLWTYHEDSRRKFPRGNTRGSCCPWPKTTQGSTVSPNRKESPGMSQGYTLPAIAVKCLKETRPMAGANQTTRSVAQRLWNMWGREHVKQGNARA
jgi:hypothetical protein